MKSKKTEKPFNKIGFSEEFLAEFGLIPSGKKPLTDKIGKPGQYINSQNMNKNK